MRAVCVEDDELAKMVEEQGLEVLKPELGTKPRVYYRNLWRYTRCFIGGTISTEIDGVVDCVEGARVRLLKDEPWVNDARSDAYGDFKFDRLAGIPATTRSRSRSRASRPKWSRRRSARASISAK